MVPEAGLEPANRKVRILKTRVFTNFTTQALIMYLVAWYYVIALTV